MDRLLNIRIVTWSLALNALLVSGFCHPNEPIQPLVYPSDLNTEKVGLGKQLFQDVRLSRDQNISCSTCHAMDKGGADSLSQSVGTHGEKTSRNTPTVLNASLNVAQFWDGRANNLIEQIDAVVKNPVEMDGDWETIIVRLEDDEQLKAAMQKLYKPALSQESISDALAEYMKALITADSPFDRYLSGDESAISADAKTGYERFKSLGCIACHQGRNIGGNLFQKAGLLTSVAEHSNITGVFNSDLGRYEVTGRERDKYLFRVPSLRNVSLTAPYFHTGSVSDLRQAIRVMAIFQLGKPISESDTELIYSFLSTLNGVIPEDLI